jgi:hypothetical protein
MRTGSTGLNCHAVAANVLPENWGCFAESARRISDAKLNVGRHAKSRLTAARSRASGRAEQRAAHNAGTNSRGATIKAVRRRWLGAGGVAGGGW